MILMVLVDFRFKSLKSLKYYFNDFNDFNRFWQTSPGATPALPRKSDSPEKKIYSFYFLEKHGLLPMNLAKMWNTDKSTFLKGI